MRIGFLGFGEAASSMAAGFREAGLNDMRAYDVLLSNSDKKDAVIAKMNGSGVVPAYDPENAVEGADVIIAAVPAQFAVQTAESARGAFKSNAIYLDVTTAGPAEKKEIAKIAEENGAKGVDGAMLGPLLKYRQKVPMLLSGKGSEEVKKLLEPYQTDMTVISDNPGDATSIKFIRSIVAKGLACLLFESLQAAQHFGVEDIVVDSFKESYGDSFEKVIDGYISGTCIHALRREHEMENVVDMLKSAELPYQMSEATREKLAAIAELKIADRFPEGVPRNWKGTIEGWGLN